MIVLTHEFCPQPEGLGNFMPPKIVESAHVYWISLVLVKGGRQHLITQLAGCTVCIRVYTRYFLYNLDIYIYIFIFALPIILPIALEGDYIQPTSDKYHILHLFTRGKYIQCPVAFFGIKFLLMSVWSQPGLLPVEINLISWYPISKLHEKMRW